MFTSVVFLFFSIFHTFIILIALMLSVVTKFLRYYLLCQAKKYNELKSK